MNPARNRICFVSIDVEDGGVENLNKFLDILKKHNIPATLFITGKSLKNYRNLVRDWSSFYEIACHGFTHRFWDTLKPSEREADLENFLNLYQEIFNQKPKGFRAPSHIIDEQALRLLEEKGFLYDSSIVPHYPPFKKYRGYRGRAPLLPHYPKGLKILEIPVRGHVFGIPLAGVWIRKLPFWFYEILFFFHHPEFITLSIHSWDQLKNFEEIIKLLEDKKYQFLNGAEIYTNYQ